MNQSHAVWTVSQGVMATMEEYGLNTTRTRIFANGITNLPKTIEKKEVTLTLQDYHISSSTPILLFVGQLIWQKNIKFIFQTLEALEAQHGNFQMVIAGNGRNEKAIKSKAAKLALKNPVIFTGKINNPTTLANLYASATLFFFPSFYDTDGIVIKEAAFYYLPTLLIKGSTIASAIQDGVNGIIIPNNPHFAARMIMDLLGQPTILEKIGLQAFKTLALSWNDTLKDLISSYKETTKDFYSER
jgi:glycosyltransferase involved in cell wall biosynthesis